MKSLIGEIEDCVMCGVSNFAQIATNYGSDIITMTTLTFYLNLNEGFNLFTSCCSYLNSRNGIFLIGIEIDWGKNTYTSDGYQKRFDNVIKRIPFSYTDEKNNPLNLSKYFPQINTYLMLGKDVLAIEVKQVPEHMRNIRYNGRSYNLESIT